MTHPLLQPAVRLMRRLRLLPKFALVGALLVAPLLLVTALLVNELQKSITLAERERLGVQYVRALQDVSRLTQQHRALRHMQLSGNAAAQEDARKTQVQLDARMAAMTSLAPLAQDLALDAEWHKTEQAWKAIRSRLEQTNAKESDAQHAAALDALQRLTALAADRSGLALDAAADSRRLMTLFVELFPGATAELARIAAHGAVYIDTGLMEPNGDVMLNSAVMDARRALKSLPPQAEAAAADHPQWRSQLEAQVKAVPQALAFLDRAQEEVLSSLNQSSGTAFFGAARQSIDALYAAADASAGLLDALLEERIARDSLRRNLMLGIIALALAAAGYLLAGFLVSFPRDVRRLEEAVARAAAGDLSQHLTSDARDEIGALCQAFGCMTRELERLVHDVRAGSDAIRTASAGIVSGQAELSARTELQAGSVQQTASAMEELTAAVAQNADSAREAGSTAAAAVEAAQRGSRVMQEAVQTMRALQAGSRQILDITAVIDKIAFQTNLLALNAAVEAARAGTHGRGFAVVANEVRSLSQLSAQSAQQIKTLIASSVSQIENGSELVHDAGAGMDNIVKGVQHMADLMTRIGAASAEQAGDIEQANQAIAQIDRTTQDNVLLVEATAAASDALQEQAARLSAAVAVFRLGITASAAGTPAAPVLPLRPARHLPDTSREETEAFQACA